MLKGFIELNDNNICKQYLKEKSEVLELRKVEFENYDEAFFIFLANSLDLLNVYNLNRLFDKSNSELIEVLQKNEILNQKISALQLKVQMSLKGLDSHYEPNPSYNEHSEDEPNPSYNEHLEDEPNPSYNEYSDDFLMPSKDDNDCDND